MVIVYLNGWLKATFTCRWWSLASNNMSDNRLTFNKITNQPIFNKTECPTYWTNDLLEEISIYNVAAVHNEQANSQDDHSGSWTVHLNSSKLYKQYTVYIRLHNIYVCKVLKKYSKLLFVTIWVMSMSSITPICGVFMKHLYSNTNESGAIHVLLNFFQEIVHRHPPTPTHPHPPPPTPTHPHPPPPTPHPPPPTPTHPHPPHPPPPTPTHPHVTIIALEHTPS